MEVDLWMSLLLFPKAITASFCVFIWLFVKVVGLLDFCSDVQAVGEHLLPELQCLWLSR